MEDDIRIVNEGEDDGLHSEEDDLFDMVVGVIEDIIMEDDFSTLMENFMQKNYEVFDESEENKIIYTQIFNDYNLEIEKYLEQQLIAILPDFEMEAFAQLLSKRDKADLEGEVFELLASFTHFNTFKELMLDFKRSKQGTPIDLGLQVIRL